MNLAEQLSQRLQGLLDDVPFARWMAVEQQPLPGPTRAADLVVEIDTPGARRLLVLEVKTEGLPRTLRRAGDALKTQLAQLPGTYGVLGAPYISDRGRAVCRELGVGCVDLAGNALLAFDQVFIERRGNPNPAPVRRLQRSLFAPRSSRVLRVLLADPARRWYVRDLAGEAGISLAQTSKVKRLLLNQDFAREDRRAFWLAQPAELLQQWAQAYSYESNGVRYFYSMLSLADAEHGIAEECERGGMPYGLAMFSGASRVAPFAQYDRAFAFVDARPDEIANSLEMKSVPSGANVVLLRPYDDGVFYGLQEFEGVQVVSDIQLYLDLKSYKGRGEEAADFLLERRIEPGWTRAPSPTTRPPQ